MPRFEIFKLMDDTYVHINPDHIVAVSVKKYDNPLEVVCLHEAGDNESYWEVKEDLIKVLRKLEGTDYGDQLL